LEMAYVRIAGPMKKYTAKRRMNSRETDVF
jgi:hypothetical protein